MAIFTRYEALRKEIKALVAENEELKQLVLLLRENQELKCLLHDHFNERNLLPDFESTRLDQQDPLVNQAFLGAASLDRSSNSPNSILQLGIRQQPPSRLSGPHTPQYPLPPSAGPTAAGLWGSPPQFCSTPSGSPSASGASRPKFAAPAASLQPSSSRGYCHDYTFPWHPHRLPSAPDSAGGTSPPFLPGWPQPSPPCFPVAPSPCTYSSPSAYQAFGFGPGGPTPAQLPPLAFWMGEGGTAGSPSVVVPVPSTFPPPPQGGQHPASPTQLPATLPGPAMVQSTFPTPLQGSQYPTSQLQPHTPPPSLALLPEVGKGESLAPDEARQPAQLLQAKESSGSVQREGAADSSSSTIHSEEKEANKQERIVGEVAFQLDRRILSSIFPDRLRLYGFTVRNIPEKISQREKDPFLQLSPEQSEAIMERYNSIMDSLKPLGYDPRVHPSLTERTVNTFGILRKRPEASSPEAVTYSNVQNLEEVVKSVVPAEMLEDCLLLLSCLQKLSQEDGKPLFIW